MNATVPTRLLSKEQIQFFNDNGYLVLKSFASDELLARVQEPLQKWADRIIKRWVKKGLLQNPCDELPFETRLCVAWHKAGKPPCNDMMLFEIVCESIFNFMTAPLFVAAASELLESHNLLVWRAFHGRAKLTSQSTTVDTPWHQDAQYHPYANNFLVMWLPLVDIDEQNSCLQIAAGHQKDGVYENHKFAGVCGFHEDVTRKLDKIIPVRMKRGDVLFMNGLLPHAALPNRTSTVRWSFDMRFERLDADQEIPHERGFVCSHENPLKIENSYPKCYEKLWANPPTDWR